MVQQDAELGQTGGHHITSDSLFFETKLIRHNFIKKVYTLISIQLLITVAIVALFTLHDGIHSWAAANIWFQMGSFGVSFAILLVIVCAGELRRKHPHNIMLLFAFTVAEALTMAAITVMYGTQMILIAGGITLAICLALTLFAIQTRYDFTVKYGIMVVVLIVAIITLSFGLLFPRSKLFLVISSAIMAVIMGIFLVIDTQMIIGGTHKIQISPEEYVFAALNIYLDIINMFLYVLTILNGSQGS